MVILSKRVLLSPGSIASFITEKIAGLLQLPKSRQVISISGIAASFAGSPIQTVINCKISPIYGDGKPMDSATSNHQTCQPIEFKFIMELPQANQPGWPHIQWAWKGRYTTRRWSLCGDNPPGTQSRTSWVAQETSFGWVLCGNTEKPQVMTGVCSHVATYHSLVESSKDLLKHFWEMEKTPRSDQASYTKEVIKHFKFTHMRTAKGRFVVPLPRKQETNSLENSDPKQFVDSSHLSDLCI